ncbi:hypothetical protein STSP2_01335 [Anaerohalosphaera lusitana]|uniref:Uncharacterized protein n=1 Tax=Anaerohalosphaera lusitana TaxID=1936003 RepID=A0A1U9NKR5_9BACT|nr:GspMb/PilO family protein [Anaerohalosphaera lusitana]AQT68180.1 hypothetical protein STSP2_01335 [Anaerohalosphaera lusitana]
MAVTITERDKRTLKIGGIAVAAILLYFLVLEPWFVGWGSVRTQLAERQEEIELTGQGGGQAKLLGVMKVVPAFEMPAKAPEQKVLFRDKFAEQLQRARINYKSFKIFEPAKTDSFASHKTIKMQVQATCKYPQVIDVLAALRENPYFAAVDELKIKQQDRKKRLIDIDLTVTTLCETNNENENTE